MTTDVLAQPRSPIENRRKRKIASFQQDNYAEFVPGAIVRIKVKNFVTYDACEVHPGPYLNMIIGPNGTGKSSIVCAIALGLGASPSLLGRAKEIHDFIKHGCQKGYIEIELKNKSNQHNTVTIRRSFARDIKGSEYKINGEISTRIAVTNIVNDLNIQIDNLCQFLPQDRVCEFAQMDSSKLLKATERAVGESDLINMHDLLVNNGKLEKTQSKDLQNKKEDLQSLCNRLQSYTHQMEKYKEYQDTLKKIEMMEKCIPWAKYQVVYNEHIELKNTRIEYKNKCKLLKKQFEPMRTELEEAQHKLNLLMEKKSSQSKVFKDYLQDFDEALSSCSRLGEKFQVIRNKSRQIKRLGKEKKEEVQKIKEEIEMLSNIEKQGEPTVDVTEINNKIESKVDQIRDIRRKILDVQEKQKDIHRDSRMIDNIIAEKGAELRKLEDIKERKLRILEGINKDAYNAVTWLRENRSMFQQHIFDPTLIEINIPDMKYAAAVENSLSINQSTMFVCQTKQDYELLTRELLDKRNMRLSVVYFGKPLAHYKPKVVDQQMRNLGFDDYLINLIQGPEPILAALCELASIHNLPVAINNVDHDRIEKMHLFHEYISNDVKYSIKYSPYGKRLSSIKTTKLKPVRLYTSSVDLEKKDLFEKEIEEARVRLQQLEKNMRICGNEEKGLRTEGEKYKQEKEELQQQKLEIRNKLDKYQRMLVTLESKRNRLVDLQRAIEENKSHENEFQIQAKEVVNKRTEKITDIHHPLDKVHDQLHSVILSLLKHSQQQSFVTKKANDFRDGEALLETSNAEYARVDQQYKNITQEARALLDQAKKATLNEEVMQMASTKSLNEWQDELTQEIARSELCDQINPHVIQQQEKLSQEVAEKQAKIKEMEINYTALKADIDRTKKIWKKRLTDLISEISTVFSAAFDRIGCAGEVQLTEHEDFEKWGISILVKFRDSEKLTQLTAQRQSGGERSVSTILYLMSLQQLSKTPFRVVDEINQGMDPRNERMVHKELVEVACKPKTSQYFLITPKLLPNLTYHRKMRVLCIFNGEYIPDSLNISKFLQFKQSGILRKAMVPTRAYNLWTHDESFSRLHVVINPEHFPDLKVDDLLEIYHPPFPQHWTTHKDEMSKLDGSTDAGNGGVSGGGGVPASGNISGGSSFGSSIGSKLKRLIVKVQAIDRELISKQSQLQISVARHIANAFGLSSRKDVIVNKVVPDSVCSEFVEFTIRDQYVGRSEMWRLKKKMAGQSIYVGEKLTFAGSIGAIVKNIYIGGEKVGSGLFTQETKAIFRSESAKYFIFIEMSKEMWDFEEDGELFFEKAVDGFLPELFQRWRDIGVNHVVSIVLFSRIFFTKTKDDKNKQLPHPSLTLCDGFKSGENFKDFYKVIVDWETRSEWHSVIKPLKKEYTEYLQSLYEFVGANLAGIRLGYSYEGNLLEAINLALNPFDKHYVDRDLLRTGLSVVVITPGTCAFHVRKDLLRMSNERMMDSGITVDVVCLSKPPLHSVPLFRFYSHISSISSNFDSRESGVNSPVSVYQSSEANTKLFSDEKPTPCSSARVLDSSEVFPGYPTQDSGILDISDPLYCDEEDSKQIPQIFYSVPFWIDASFYSTTRTPPPFYSATTPTFIPRCKMREFQMTNCIQPTVEIQQIPFLEDSLGSNSDGKEFNEATLDSNFHDQYDQDVFSFHSRYGSNKGRAESDPSISRSFSTEGIPLDSSGGNKLDSANSRPQTKETSLRITGQSSEMAPSREFEISKSKTHSTVIKSNSGNSKSQSLGEKENMKKIDIPMTNSLSLKNQHRKPILSYSADGSEFTGWLNNYNKGRLPDQPKSLELNEHLLERGSTLKKRSKPIAIMTNLPNWNSRTSACASPRSYQDAFFNRPFSYMGNNSKQRPSSTKGFVGKPASGEEFLINPFNPTRNSFLSNCIQILRWEHVYPRLQQAISTEADMNWVSLCSPACLPLTTEYFPNPHELTHLYQEYTYTVSPNDEGLSRYESQKVEDLISELIFQRLSQGFQIILNDQTEITMKQSANTASVYTIPTKFKPDKSAQMVEGKFSRQRLGTLKSNGTVPPSIPHYYLGMGDQIHRLSYDSSGQNVEVKRYVRKISYKTNPIEYSCLVWRKYNHCYEMRQLSFHYPKSSMYNWNYVDHLVAGYQDEMTDSLKFWRTRFLLIPMWSGSNGNTGRALKNFLNPSGENLDEEELWIAGFRRFIEAVQKSKLLTPQERESLTGKLIPPPNYMDITLTTLNPSSHIISEVDGFMDQDSESGLRSSIQRRSGFSSSTHSNSAATEYLMKDSPPQSIVSAMENPNTGVSFRNRRWHLRLYENVCIGHELIDWLIRNFSDINNREDACEFGNMLLEKGVIQHARKRHRFMDGYYFYRIGKQFEKSTRGDEVEKKRTGWFSRTISSMSGVHSNSEFDESERGENVVHGQKFYLTKAISLDLDPHRRSDRKEVAILHYDTLHNPKNCYHFHLHWLVCTSQLIENLLQSWTRMAEKCGFRLVEAEVEQARLNSDDNPFQSPVPIKLAVKPPNVVTSPTSVTGSSQSNPSTPDTDTPFQSPNSETAKTLGMVIPSNYFQSELLKSFGFILDVEADHHFPVDSVQYSFHKTPYAVTQYVHSSGVAFVQICENSEYDFIWVNNRLFTSHYIGSNTRHHSAAQFQQQQPLKESFGGVVSGGAPPNPDQLCLEFEQLCQDQSKLKHFWGSVCNSLNTAAGMGAVFDMWPDPLVVTTGEGVTVPPILGKCGPVGVDLCKVADMLNLEWNRLEVDEGISSTPHESFSVSNGKVKDEPLTEEDLGKSDHHKN